ncbi:hypothetical protein N7454_008046 [Penicillium verhagenii]|nr:hypothetical protein N7454_008046 [Penicillium verhagenii]
MALPPFSFNWFFSIQGNATNATNKQNDTQEILVSWVHTVKPPLFWEPMANHPISLKLSNMKAALSAGADPNEMDHERDRRRSLGRPLHCAIGDWAEPEYMKENIPVIKLLLRHGADPRLPGPEVKPAAFGLQSPLEYARRLAMREWNGVDELFECGYYTEAYRIMKEAADNLDRR